MTEEQKPEETQEEQPEEAPLSVVDRAEGILKKIEDREEELNKREKQLAEQMLAGSAGGGVPTKTLTEEEQKVKEAIEFWKGTGIDKAIEEHQENG